RGTDRSTAAAENVGEDLTGRDDSAGLRRRSSRAVRTDTEVEERNGALLRRGAEAKGSAWILRRVRNRDTSVITGSGGKEREQDGASALQDVDEVQRLGGREEAQDGQRGGGLTRGGGAIERSEAGGILLDLVRNRQTDRRVGA